MSIQHQYTQTVADGTATSVVRPSDWNSAHKINYALGGNTAGSASVSGLDVAIYGGNNITVSADTANSRLYFSAFNQSTQTQAAGNIAGVGYTSTTQAGSTVGMTHGTDGLSAAWPPFLTTQSVQTQASGAIAGSGFSSTTTAGTAIVGTNNSQGLSLGVPQFLTTQSVQTQASGNIAGTGTTFAGTNVSATVALNSVGLNLSLSAPAGGGGGFTASGYNHYNDVVQVAGQVGQGTLNFDPVNLDFPVQFDRLGVPIAYTATSNSTGSQTLSLRVGIFTNNAGTLSLYTSASTAITAANSGTAGAYSLFSGVRLVTLPFTTTLQPGDYWLGVISSTSSSNQNGASISAMLQSNLGSNFVGFFGQSHNTTQQYTLGQGVFSVTTGAMPNSVAFSQIRGSDSAAARPPIVAFYSGTV